MISCFTDDDAMVRKNVKPHIDMLPEGTTFSYETESAAFRGLQTAITEGHVEILQ